MLRYACGFCLADRGYDLRWIQDYLDHRDAEHTGHHACIAARRFEGRMALMRPIPPHCGSIWRPVTRLLRPGRFFGVARLGMVGHR